MSIYIYPAILTYDDDCYYVKFPDIDNCFTDGSTRQEALEMANDVLPLMLCDYEDKNLEIPTPSKCENIKLSSNEEVVLVKANTTLYRKKHLKDIDVIVTVANRDVTAGRTLRLRQPLRRKAAAKKAAQKCEKRRKTLKSQCNEADKKVLFKRS